MTIINTSPDRIIQLGYEGEDRVTVLRFRYGADWLENGEGIFHIRVRRHGEHTAYNAALVADDAENNCLLMTVTNVELSVKGSGEMQAVYSGADFVKKSPIYSYNVSRAVDEVTDPPAQDVYTQIIESLSDLQTDVSGITEDIGQIENSIGALSALTTAKIGDLTELTTEAKSSLVSAINEVNSKSVDDALSATSTNPVQNKVLTARINSLDSDVGTLRTSVQSKADIQTVSALADAVQGLDSDVQGLQTTMQNKADTSTVTALSGTVSSLSDTTQQYMEYTNSAITDLQDNKASKSYVDGELATKANVQTVTALSGTVTDLQANKADKTYVDVQLDGKASTQTVSDLVDDVYDIYPTDTASGVIANFPDGANSVPVKSLTVAIEPVQDLHGYANPWPAGGGVNLVDTDELIPATGTAYNKYGWKNVLKNNTTYTYSVYGETGYAFRLMAGHTKEAVPQPNIGLSTYYVASGRYQTFTTPSDIEDWEYLFLGGSASGSANANCQFQIELGENSNPTYRPYSNVCPITGWTGAKVTRCGKNLLDDSIKAVFGSRLLIGATSIYDNPTYLKAGTYSITVFGVNQTFAYLMKSPNALKTIVNGTNHGSFTVDNDGYYRIDLYGNIAISGDVTGVILVPSSTYATAYEPYQGETYEVEFPTEAGTVYGGTLDVTTGVLTVDRAQITSYAGETLPGTWISDRDVYAAGATPTTGAQVVYELATPITYQLTPQEVSTLLGQNNIWADAGDTTVEYRANTSAYIAKKIAEAISALS